MPLSSAGVLSRKYNWIADRDAGTKILADRMDGEFDNYLAAINAITSGAVPLRGPMRNVGGTAANPAWSFVDDPNTGVYRDSEDNLGLTGGNTTLTIGAAGLVYNGKSLIGVGGFVFTPPDGNGASAGYVINDETGAERARIYWHRSLDALMLRIGDGTTFQLLRLTKDGVLMLGASPVQSIDQATADGAIGPQPMFLKCDVAVSVNDRVAGSKLHIAGFNADSTIQASTGSLTGTFVARGRCGAGGATTFIRVA